jgi:hypothetical protein
MSPSLYRNIGIDPRTEYRTRLGRPVTLVRNGKPIPQLFG